MQLNLSDHEIQMKLNVWHSMQDKNNILYQMQAEVQME